MNETIKTILSRRSIRVFRPEQIPAEALEEVVTAGQYAPSAMGAQQWLLVAVRDRELMARLGEDCRRTLNREGDPSTARPQRCWCLARRTDTSPSGTAPV